METSPCPNKQENVNVKAMQKGEAGVKTIKHDALAELVSGANLRSCVADAEEEIQRMHNFAPKFVKTIIVG